MSKRSILDSKALMLLWSFFFLVTFLASILIVNPTLNPQRAILSWPQLQLQFAYTPENGIKVLESWGAGSIDRYFSVIWIDLVFAVSYGPAFFFYIRRLGGSTASCMVPLVEAVTNLIETSLEIYWVGHHHAPDNMLAAPFLIHSIIATIKWSLVPVYSIHLGMLFYSWMRSRAMDVAFRQTTETR
ncbi:hypothetical protein [Pendulispora albinea]|uniref:EXPERA domain-containing protein n=1 Tax=Pendulispora albinea TaxID=2741071 RepID=A0ABZ2LZX5_9BACT